MDYVLLFIGLLILSALGYTIFKLNKKVDSSEDPKKSIEEINKMREIITLEFKNLANDIIDEKTKKINELNKESLSNILNPLKENLDKFERKVDSSNKNAIEFNAILKSEINHLKNETIKIRNDANNLANALKGESKTQGDWGEHILENILNSAGLEKNIHYEKEKNIKNENLENQRPDYVVKLPEDKCIIIDSKVSLVSYVKYYNSEDEEEKKIYLKDHLKSINNHITTLSNKNYQALDINQPDYILMFMANEPAFKLAVLEEESLYNKAIDKNILIVTSSTLYATLKTVAYMWKQDKSNKNAIEIARQAGSLYDKFHSFTDDLIKIGHNLNTTKNTYNDAMNKLTEGKDNLIRKTERLRELGAKTRKKIDPKLIERSK